MVKSCPEENGGFWREADIRKLSTSAKCHRTNPLRRSALRARLVQKRDLREHIEPSNPRMAGGANVQPLLIARP